MAELSDREIEILNREIDKQGLTYTQLQKSSLTIYAATLKQRWMKDRNS